MKKIFTLIALLTILSSGVYAQNTDSLRVRYDYFSQYLSPEKLYLHIDRNIFTPGETIWFKGYLENKSYQSVMPTSNYVYVELLRDSVISRVLLKKSEDGFTGQMVLPDDIALGEYILRAYTNWNKNLPAEYMFYSKIRIVGSEGVSEKETTRKKPDLKIDFYPESGRYFAGTMTTMAFKTNYSNLKGVIKNSKDEKIADFCTEHNGMGRFMFLPAEGERYYAEISSDVKSDAKYTLPDPSIEGGMINIRYKDEEIIIHSFLLKETASLILHNGSEIYYCEPVGAGSNLVRVAEKGLARGINHAILMSPEGTILAERLFFIYESDNVGIDLNFDKDQYKTRERVVVSTTLKDTAGQPVAGEFSVSVIDGNFKLFSQEESIDSYMLISSELKGKINDPGFYFNRLIPLKERKSAADLLMMVQGWRYYDMENLYSHHPQVKYGKEFNQSISGYVKSANNNKSETLSLTLFSSDIGYYYKGSFSGNDFYIDSLDFQDGTRFFIQPEGKSRRKEFIVNTDNDHTASLIEYDKLYQTTMVNSDQNSIKNEIPVIYNDYIRLRKLNEVVLTESAYYKPKHNPSPYGQPLERRSVKERADLKKDDNEDVIDYIVENNPGFFKSGLSIDADQKIYSQKSATVVHKFEYTSIGKNEPILFIDGLKQESTSNLKGLSVRDIETLAVLRGNDGALYGSVWGVIMITTRRGDTEKQVDKSNGIKISPLGWQKPTRFYSPVYDTEELYTNPKPDYRTTLYWNPSIKTDRNGIATFEFYTSDYNNPFVIRIEGKTDDCRYIRY
ncbi:MAG: MG2 domain-containing protein [Bacteroidales bacterium]|nr:MG2 domain-containing protein [Bacteroidales bacterium]